MKLMWQSLAIATLIGCSNALVTQSGERAGGPKHFHTDDEEVVRVVEPDIVGSLTEAKTQSPTHALTQTGAKLQEADEAENAGKEATDDDEVVRVAEPEIVGSQTEAKTQPPTHALTQTRAKLQEADEAEDAVKVADSIEKATEYSDAKITDAKIATNAEDEEVVKVVEADVVQDVTSSSGKSGGMVDAEVKDEQEENDDDDDDDDNAEDKMQAKGSPVKPHPSQMQMSAPKIKAAVAAPEANTSNTDVHTAARPKQVPNATINTTAHQPQALLAKKNLRSAEAKTDEKRVSEDMGSEVSHHVDETSQAQEEIVEAPRDEAPVETKSAAISDDCNKGNEFNNNNC